MLRGALEGVRTVAANPVLVSLTLAAALTGMADRVVGVLFLLYLVDDVGFSPGALGVIFAVGGARGGPGGAAAARGDGDGGGALPGSAGIAGDAAGRIDGGGGDWLAGREPVGLRPGTDLLRDPRAEHPAGGD